MNCLITRVKKCRVVYFWCRVNHHHRWQVCCVVPLRCFFDERIWKQKIVNFKKHSRTLKILKDLKVLKVQILSDKKMDAHVQKQTYYQLRGTSWIIGIGWQQHSRATNYLSQQANSRLSLIQNFKNFESKFSSNSSWNQFKIAERRKHSKNKF